MHETNDPTKLTRIMISSFYLSMIAGKRFAFFLGGKPVSPFPDHA
jgi:hypothetical protein